MADGKHWALNTHNQLALIRDSKPRKASQEDQELPYQAQLTEQVCRSRRRVLQSSPSALVKQGTHSIKETGHRTESLIALLVETDFIQNRMTIVPCLMTLFKIMERNKEGSVAPAPTATSEQAEQQEVQQREPGTDTTKKSHPKSQSRSGIGKTGHKCYTA